MSSKIPGFTIIFSGFLLLAIGSIGIHAINKMEKCAKKCTGCDDCGVKKTAQGEQYLLGSSIAIGIVLIFVGGGLAWGNVGPG